MKLKSRIILCLIAFAIPAKCSTDHSHDAPIGKYEHHVSIQFNGEHACSGSIYNERHILTSSSCIMGTPPEDITIFAGATSLAFTGDSYEIEKTIMPESIFEDIALLRTKKPITFRRGVRKIKLANYNDYHNDRRVRVIGWELPSLGKLRNNNMLQEFSLRLYDKDECRRKNTWANDKFVCIYDSAGQKICDIDEGGAIIADGLQIGIFLNKGSCYDAKDPLPHTSVYDYLDWIKKNSHAKRDNDRGSGPTHDESYPYHVSIRRRNKHICSGSIINERHVLTSNNCIMSVAAKDLRIVAGINSLNSKARVYRVQKIVSTYDDNYDIAILRITRKIIFNDRVNSIPVASSSDVDDSEEITLTGWERENGGGHRNAKLQSISLQTYDREKCNSAIPFHSEAYTCVEVSNQNFCNMDYGSPIVANGVQIALNPFGVRCENNDEAHLILPLSRHLSWIDRHSRV